MNVLRRALVASVVSALTALGLVATAGTAAAAPRDELLQLYGVVPVQSDGDGVTYTPAQAYAAIQAQCDYNPAMCPPEAVGEVVIGPSPAGTAAGVKAGSGLLAKVCPTAKQCGTLVGGFLAMLGMQGLAMDWGLDPTAEGVAAMDVDDVAYYANAPTYPCWANTVDQIGMTGQFKMTVVQTAGRWTPTCQVTYQIAVDCVRVSDGAWLHTQISAQTNMTTNQPGTYTMTIGNPCNQGTPHELRRMHFKPMPHTSTDGPTRGFYWGQEIIKPDSQIKSNTGCKRPDGSEYVVTAPAVAANVGGANVAACNAGDTPIWNELVQCDSAGLNCVTQSVISLRPPTTAPEQFAPDCATAGCRWFVKVDGLPCYTGLTGCTNWTEHKERATCWYGPYQMPLSNCYWLERAYETRTPGQTIPASGPNTDGNPTTWEGPAVNPTHTPRPTPTPTPSPSVPSPTPTPTTSAPPATGTPPVIAACATPYALGPVQTEAVALANLVGPMFDVDTIYGYREPTQDWAGEHSSGLALDFMTGTDTAQGQQIADYLQANASRLGVRWIIWNQQVWNIERAAEGWRDMEDRGSDTENHKDHVHVYLYDRDPSGVTCTGDPTDGGAGGGCLSRTVSWNPVDWVYWPVRCTLEWAFIPPGGSAFFDSQLDTLGAKFRASPVGAWWAFSEDVGTGVSGFSSGSEFHASRLDDVPDPTRVVPDDGPSVIPSWSAGGGDLCEGPAVSLGSLSDVADRIGDGGIPQEIHPFNACSGVMATAAATSRIVITAMLAYSIFWTTLRQIGAAFNFSIPGAPDPTTTYGGDDYGPDRRSRA